MATIPTPAVNSADVGLIGLAVMGQNLALNMADHGHAVAVYNRTTEKTQQFIADNPPRVFGDTGGSLVPAAELKDFVASLKRPRRVVILVQAGRGTDAVIDALAPLMEQGDLIIDGGNAHFPDTTRRQNALTTKGLHFIGSGVSGGELGARFGPSLMPGGSKEAWPMLKPIWEAIASKVDPATGKELTGASQGKPITGGEPCTAWIGPGGSGHYVKMVHNGIEYADMQLICEAYHLIRELTGRSPSDIAQTFAKWNSGDLDSFLIEITADILRQKDPVTGEPFVDVVLDTAQQKGTGKWTGTDALDRGVPAVTIAEAVFARSLSALKDQRVSAARTLAGPGNKPGHGFENDDAFIDAVGRALYGGKVCAYAQGFQLMQAASDEENWNIDFASLAAIWRGGCIIRARFLQRITDAYRRDGKLPNLLLDPYFAEQIAAGQNAWRRVVSAASLNGIPAPAFASSLAYYDGYRSARLPANLLQAQRDYFGAHTYERGYAPRGKHFHIDWPHPERPQLDA